MKMSVSEIKFNGARDSDGKYQEKFSNFPTAVKFLLTLNDESFLAISCIGTVNQI